VEVSGQIHPLAALSLGKELLVPLDRRLGEPQSRSGCCGEEKILPLEIIIEYTYAKKED
jgi:hypothetical protein